MVSLVQMLIVEMAINNCTMQVKSAFFVFLFMFY